MGGRRIIIYTVRFGGDTSTFGIPPLQTPHPVYLVEQQCLKAQSPSEMEGRARIFARAVPALLNIWGEGYIHNML